VFFIALQYLPSYNKELINKCRYLLSFDGIDIRGVNQTGDTALHLALYGKKWDVAEKILTAFQDYDVNTTNSLGETALHLALQLQCKSNNLLGRILARTHSENINKSNGNGDLALHLVCKWKDMPSDFRKILEKSSDVNAQDERGNTALHVAIFNQQQVNCWAVSQLVKREDVRREPQE
jgi:ankyrin repeat protein